VLRLRTSLHWFIACLATALTNSVTTVYYACGYDEYQGYNPYMYILFEECSEGVSAVRWALFRLDMTIHSQSLASSLYSW